MARLTAASADRQVLYERSVQCVEADIDFALKVYKKRFDRKPHTLKEDFCGTAAAAVEFVSRSKKNRAVGIDLDQSVLDWGRKHNLPKLGKRSGDVELRNANVLEVSDPKVDMVFGMNFSYFCFKERETLKKYFANALDSLNDEGLLILDAYGGWEAQEPQEEHKEFDDFTYVWDQYSYDPITGDVMNYIHFLFPDGSRINRAFSYDWRLWTLREITDLLKEVGFKNADVYWEGWDEKNEEGDGKFKKVTTAESCAGWVAYIIGEK